jgi:hypothetical protein
MATYTAHSAIGQREDLADTIYQISPSDTPFISSVGRGKATNSYHEWQTDSLTAAASNAAVEGAAASSITVTPTTRLGNRTQISQKTVAVSGTLEATTKAGRKSEMAYQMAKEAKSLKKDMEFALLSNQVSAAGNSSTARALGGLQTWIGANGDFGTSGVTGASGTTARTQGTDRTFTETILKTVVKETYEAGGDPSVLMVNPGHKQTVSGFAGIAAQRYMAPADQQTTIIGAADVYLGDFGQLSVVPNRIMVAGNACSDVAFVLSPDMAKVAYLRDFQKNEIARVGDAETQQLVVEYTLEVSAPSAHGLCADLT